MLCQFVVTRVTRRNVTCVITNVTYSALMTTKSRADVRYRIPPDLAEWVAAEAAARDVSPSSLAAKALAHLPAILHGGPVVAPPTAEVAA